MPIPGRAAATGKSQASQVTAATMFQTWRYPTSVASPIHRSAGARESTVRTPAASSSARLVTCPMPTMSAPRQTHEATTASVGGTMSTRCNESLPPRNPL